MMATAVHPGPKPDTHTAPSHPGRPRRNSSSGVGDRSPLGLSWGLILPSILIVGIVSIFPIVYAVNLSVHETRYMES